MDTRDVAEFIVTASFDKLSSDVVAKVKMCVLDILGGSLAAHKTKSANCVREVVQRMDGRGGATLIGVGTKVSAPLAAWSNGFSWYEMCGGMITFNHEDFTTLNAQQIIADLALAKLQRASLGGVL